MDALRTLKAQKIRQGVPLYRAVRDALQEAVETGIFQPGNRMPSTKLLSEKLDVSLVTAHRALQELVGTGVLQRAQGRGTYVHANYLNRMRISTEMRIGLILSPELSFADFHYCILMEGIRRSAIELGADIMFLRSGEDVRNECSGYLLVTPLAEQADNFIYREARKPIVVLDSSAGTAAQHRVRVDPTESIGLALSHLMELGHTRIGFLGGNDASPNGLERWKLFSESCKAMGIGLAPKSLLRTGNWRLDEPGQVELLQLLKSELRPTAIFAAGYCFAVDVYRAAAQAGLEIPGDISVIGIDDAPSASHLAPPLTTIRQPLMDMAKRAVDMLVRLIGHHVAVETPEHVLPAVLMRRESTAPPRT